MGPGTSRLPPNPGSRRADSCCMSVSSIMSRPVITVSMDDTLETVRGLFQEERFHHAVVVEEGKVVGVVSDRDLLRNISPFAGRFAERAQDAQSLQRKVHQVMTRRLVSIAPDAPIARAAETMLLQRVSCLPVLDEAGACIGIVTLRDILRWTVRTADQLARGERPAA
jgi:acetoin utilization protein AcuB